jgi:cytochrome c oxidase cbb3-type subunit I/II
VKSLPQAFWEHRDIKAVAIPPVPARTPERVERGRPLYADAECWQCHSDSGRGDGPSAPTVKDNTEMPIKPTDPTSPARFKNGAAPRIFTVP